MLSSPQINTSASIAPLSQAAVHQELNAIAAWWLSNAPDAVHGGFVGEIDYFGKPVANASKGVVLHSRLLWFFSALARAFPSRAYSDAADRAYQVLMSDFDDVFYGGAVWELSFEHSVIDDKKQIYAQCFCIYALSAYHALTKNESALRTALAYFERIERHARDHEQGGYIEALDRRWQPLDDLRLSDKDLNVPKSMNTHLHVLEAYTALYKLAPRSEIADALQHTLMMFDKHIIDHGCGHLRMFFDNSWNDKSTCLSFGHDIEASWLLLEAAQALGDGAQIAYFKSVSISIVNSNLRKAIGQQGQVLDELDIVQTQSAQPGSQDSVWWIQAEALVAYLSAYKLTRDTSYLNVAQGVWQFIQRHHLDRQAGEWHWLVSDNIAAAQSIYKAGFWKGPYHNGRAMLEAYQRLPDLSGAP